jgi:hypothetical protein
MVSRIILALVQLVVGWFGAPHIVRYVPDLGVLQLFVYAAAFAVLVWIVGLALSQGLKDMLMPSTSTLAAALVGALIGAALIMVLPTVAPDVLRLLPRIPPHAFPLVGAILGYQVR